MAYYLTRLEVLPQPDGDPRVTAEFEDAPNHRAAIFGSFSNWMRPDVPTSHAELLKRIVAEAVPHAIKYAVRQVRIPLPPADPKKAALPRTAEVHMAPPAGQNWGVGLELRRDTLGVMAVTVPSASHGFLTYRQGRSDPGMGESSLARIHRPQLEAEIRNARDFLGWLEFTMDRLDEEGALGGLFA